MIVYIAAYEGGATSYDLSIEKDRSVFLSYYYQPLCDKVLPTLKPNGHKGIITIDSGAHSFFEILGTSATSNKKKGDKKIKSPQQFFEGYIKWIEKNYNLIDYFVELDLQEILGQEKIVEWRNLLKEKGLYDKCITVHHSWNTIEHFHQQIDDSQSRYIGIEGLRVGKEPIKYMQFIKYAYEHGVKIHGFAMTNTEILHLYPFYSVDSSSWKACIRFGCCFIWNENKMDGADNKSSFIKYKLPMKSHSSKRSPEDNRHNLNHQIKQFDGMEKYFTKLWEERGVKW